MSRPPDSRGPHGGRRPEPRPRLGDRPEGRPGARPRFDKPALRVFTTTLWEYPSQDYPGFKRNLPGGVQAPAAADAGPEPMAGATPSWVVWQLLTRYTRPRDLVVDPMAGSGTTIDVARELGRRALGYDLTPRRPDVFRADARKLPLEDAKADFVFIDPPYSTHLTYSDNPFDIGALDAGDDGAAGVGYYEAMGAVFREAFRVLRDRRYVAVYVSDSWRKRRGGEPGSGAGTFMPIGFEIFGRMRRLFRPVDVVCVVRHNAKLKRGQWHAAAEEGNFFLRGFNYLLIFKKETEDGPPARGPDR